MNSTSPAVQLLIALVLVLLIGVVIGYHFYTDSFIVRCITGAVIGSSIASMIRNALKGKK